MDKLLDTVFEVGGKIFYWCMEIWISSFQGTAMAFASALCEPEVLDGNTRWELFLKLVLIRDEAYFYRTAVYFRLLGGPLGLLIALTSKLFDLVDRKIDRDYMEWMFPLLYEET